MLKSMLMVRFRPELMPKLMARLRPDRAPSPPVVVACVWALSTLYLFIARAQRMERPWEMVLNPPAKPVVDDRDLVVLCVAGALTLLACQMLARHPLWAMTLLVLSALIMNYDIHSSGITPDQYLPVCVALFLAAAAGSGWTVVGAAGTASSGVVGYVGVCLSRGIRVDTSVEAVVLLTVALAAVLGDSRRRERLHAEQARVQAAEQAVTAERLRIARELHDMVAHTIGVVALQAGAAKLVVRRRPEDAHTALGTIEDASRETLAGLRRMLGALHEAGGVGAANRGGAAAASVGLDGIEELVASAQRAGVRVDVEWRGERRTLPPEVDLSVFRIVQESVTNVMKHSGARQCRVSVDFSDDALGVAVVDSGTRRSGDGRAGYGLNGMRERVELLHGEFAAGPRAEGGFRVAARIPVPVEAA